MNTFYEVFDLTSPAPELFEPMGTKAKFWFRMKDDKRPWLFKYPREGTGEAWAEKVAAEIAEVLGICHAQVELATYAGRQGTITRSFVDRKRGFDLVHGSEVLAGSLFGYDKTLTFHQSQHTLDNIFIAVSKTISDSIREEQLSKLASYFVLDALIGNTDRHHDNWGLLVGPRPQTGNEYSVAPSFDHASSLGRELKDVKRAMMICDGRIGYYAGRGRGAVYWHVKDAHGLNPIELVHRATERYATYIVPWLDKVRMLNTAELQDIISRVPGDWMSQMAKDFCDELLAISLKALLEGR